MESDLNDNNFLKEYEKVLGYKSHFEIRSKIQFFMRLKWNSLVPIFVLADEVTKVMMEMTDTLDVCEAEVISEKIGMDEVQP